MSDTGRFLGAFVRDPLHTAAVVPSSTAVADAMAADLPPTGVILELGAGTGAVSAAIAARTTARRVAVELIADWAQLLAERDPGLEVVTGDVRDLDALLDDHGVGAVDAVVSGLPWAAHVPHPGRPPLIDVLAARLTATGTLRQLGYSATRWAPPARRQQEQLRAAFHDVATTPTIWRNLPPAVVHRAARPRR